MRPRDMAKSLAHDLGAAGAPHDVRVDVTLAIAWRRWSTTIGVVGLGMMWTRFVDNVFGLFR